MSNTTISPNMGLIIPTVSSDPGPDWATNLNASLSILDQHNHSNGSGVQITPAGLNINSDLSFNNLNNLIMVRSVRFAPQGSPLALAADLGCLYEAGVDLYYNDGSGNQIRITQSGSVAGSAGTITGLPSGTASAAFSAGTFTFQAATLTPANIDGGSFILRNNVASSKGLTLSPPNAMAANYTLTLPALPASTLPISLDTSGNMVAAAITQAQLAQRATGSTVAAGGVATSYVSSFSTTSSGNVGFSCTIVTTGRPVSVGFYGGTSGGTWVARVNGGSGASAEAFVEILRSSSPISNMGMNLRTNTSGTTIELDLPSSAFNVIDFPSAGTYTYTVNMAASGANVQALCNDTWMVVYEL